MCGRAARMDPRGRRDVTRVSILELRLLQCMSLQLAHHRQSKWTVSLPLVRENCRSTLRTRMSAPAHQSPKADRRLPPHICCSAFLNDPSDFQTCSNDWPTNETRAGLDAKALASPPFWVGSLRGRSRLASCSRARNPRSRQHPGPDVDGSHRPRACGSEATILGFSSRHPAAP